MTYANGPLGTHHEPLARHALDLNTRVTVDLLTAVGPDGSTGTHRVTGRVADATTAILLIEHDDGTAIRIPWPAIAAIRDTHPAHPAL